MWCITRPALRRRLLWALVAQGAAFAVVFVLMAYGAHALASSLLAGLPGWMVTVVAVAEGLLVLALAVLVGPVLFRVLSSLVAPLFNQGIFDAARAAAGGSEPCGPGLSALQGILGDVRRLVRLLVGSALLLLLNAVPGIGSAVYVVAQALFTAHLLCWDLLSYHFEMVGVPYREQARWLRRQGLAVLAFGGMALLLTMIPVLNFVTVTTNVAAAGLWSARLEGRP